jgi:hypothetical protein
MAQLTTTPASSTPFRVLVSPHPRISANMRSAILAAAITLALATSASAQTAAIYGAGLEAWTGCWSAELNPAPAGAIRLVCISPTANVNIANDATIDGNDDAYEAIDATGRTLTLQAQGCTGTRRAAWSRDGRRLFLNTTGVCRGVPLSTSAIYSISSSGEWVTVEGSTLRGAPRVRAARFRDVGVPVGLPVDIAAAVRKNELARESTRAAFGAAVHLDDVVEALRFAEADVVAAWVREGAQQFDVTQADLARIDLRGFPRVAAALTGIADSTAGLARAADSASYASYAWNQHLTSSSGYDYSDFDYSDFVPLGYWGAGYAASFPSRRGGMRGGPRQGGGTPPSTSGGTVRLGHP